MERNFRQLLETKWSEGKFVCVGLDTDMDNISETIRTDLISECRAFTNLQIEYNARVIHETHDLVCAYKPDLAFYLSRGAVGIEALIQTIKYINFVAPSVPVILDAKWADIGNSNNHYVAFLNMVGADAVTVNPYLGYAGSIDVFLKDANKGVFVLCRTSNGGSREFQSRYIEGEEAVFEVVAKHVSSAWDWNSNGNCGLITDAIFPEDIGIIRRRVGDIPLLIPDIGKQDGDLEKTLQNAMDSCGEGMIINSSSNIIFASTGTDFAEAARRETEKLHFKITQIREKVQADK